MDIAQTVEALLALNTDPSLASLKARLAASKTARRGL